MKEELLKRLDALAATLKTTTEMLWGVLVREAKVEAFFWTLVLVFVWAVVIATWKYSAWARTVKNPDGEYIDRWGDTRKGKVFNVPSSDTRDFLHVLTFVNTILGIIGTPFLLYAALIPLCNPQYWALNQLMGLLK